MRALLPLLLLLACGDEPPVTTIDHTPRVEVVRVQAAPTSLTRTLLSTLAPAHDALITPMRPGRVVERSAEPGTTVRAQAPLLKLDAREARANLAAAEAAVSEAEAVLGEAKRQVARVAAIGAGASTAQRDQASTGEARAASALAGAEAQRELARVNLDEMTVRAPFAGEVAMLVPQVGESVAASAGPVARVVDTSYGTVVVGLVEDEVDIASGPDATFTVLARGHEVPATLNHLSPAADPRTLTWAAELRVDDPPFPSGTPVEVRIALPSAVAAGLLPAKAVRNGQVWRVQDDTVSRAVVQVVGEAREGLLVTGIEVGDEVVLFAAEPLEDGQAVVRLESP